MFGRKRGRGRPPKYKKRNVVIFRLAVLLIVCSIATVSLFKLGVISNEQVINFGKSVLGAISTEGKDKVNWNDRLRKILTDLLANSKSSILKGVKESLKMEEDKVVFRFVLISDSHEDTVYFPEILRKARDYEIDILIHLGDFSNAGSSEKLRQAKGFLDQSGLEYFAIPGDHDYNWLPDHDLQNFKKVFGEATYKSFIYQDIYFILLDNSDHELGLGASQMGWLKGSLLEANRLSVKAILVFTHVPLYNEIFPDKVMGNSSLSKEVMHQREELIGLFEDFEVDYIFSGDVHHFSQYFEPDSRLIMVTVGAACGEGCKNFLPQFVLVTVYEDGKMEITPKPYKGLKDIR